MWPITIKRISLVILAAVVVCSAAIYERAGAQAAFSIRGQVTGSGGVGIKSVTVTLSGGQSASTTTDSEGNYSFSGLNGGASYTVTPTLSGYQISPARQSFANLSSNLVADFMGYKLFTTCTSPNFRGAANFTVGRNPQEPVEGDFNGDGELDIAVINSGDNTVSVLLGLGNSTFQPAINYFVGNNPSSATVGDFNGDGALDLAVANYRDNDVSVLLGNGDGTFQFPAAYSAGTNPSSVSAGDFNGDGVLDLAVANSGDNDVSVLLGNGDGTFQDPVNYTTGLNPDAVVVGDFNGDGKLDLAVISGIVVGQPGAALSVLLGRGDGTFQKAMNSNFSSAESLAVADFNGDGKLDLVVGGFNGGVVLLGNGDGTFHFVGGSGPGQVVVGDFNGDGKLDIATADFDLSVQLGNGDGTFKEPVRLAANLGLSLIAGDFNGDGKPDLAGVNGAGGLSVLPNDCGFYSISGRITTSGRSASFAGATLTLTGSVVATTTINGNGTYTFAHLPQGGNYRVKPVLQNFTFSPFDQTFTDVQANQIQNFTASDLLSALVIDPRVVGGCPSGQTGLVTLTGPAPPGGITVNISNTNSAATFPTSVVVPAGTSQGSFNWSTPLTNPEQTGTITASLGAAQRAVSLTLLPVRVGGLTLSAHSVAGGQTLTGVATLDCVAPYDVFVTFSSSNTAAARAFPHSLTIPAGTSSANFNVQTSPRTSYANATIYAQANGAGRSEIVTVMPLSVSALVLPSKVVGGCPQARNGTVSLTGPAPAGGVSVTIASANSAATFPMSVMVPAGASQAGFNWSTRAVASRQTGTVTATLGPSSNTISLTVRPIGVGTLMLASASVTGGNSTTGTVTLDCAATSDTVVSLTSSNNAAQPSQASITIPAGENSGNFTVNTSPVAAQTNANITAVANGIGVSQTLTINH